MPTKTGLPYDHSNHVVRREAFAAGAAGTGVKNRTMTFQKGRVKAAHFKVRTAGTAAGFTGAVVHGTTTIGTQTFGTAAANSTFSLEATSPGNDGDAFDDIHAVIAGDNTGVVDAVYEYEVLPGAALTE